jgi:hypothetical protein
MVPRALPRFLRSRFLRRRTLTYMHVGKAARYVGAAAVYAGGSAAGAGGSGPDVGGSGAYAGEAAHGTTSTIRTAWTPWTALTPWTPWTALTPWTAGLLCAIRPTWTAPERHRVAVE